MVSSREITRRLSRVVAGFGPDDDGGAGVLRLGGIDLRIICSSGGGWDHISVSLPDRCPTWDEMSHVKRLFFGPTEWAMELHPAVGENVNNHPYCLHLWRPQDGRLPLPPSWMVGLRPAPPVRV
jgi:hypothetical protein